MERLGKQHLIIGNEGGERGVRGWVAAYDINTGELKWKYYNTGPNDLCSDEQRASAPVRRA